MLDWLFGPEEHGLTAGECQALMEWARPSTDPATGKMKLYGKAVTEFPQVLMALAAEAVSHGANAPAGEPAVDQDEPPTPEGAAA